ncbi:MAG: T9SS type A sorting domain-containing protein [Bacteroidia bacterium]
MKRHYLILVLLFSMLFFAFGKIEAQDLRSQKYLERLLEEKIRWPKGMKPGEIPAANLAKNQADEHKLSVSIDPGASEAEAHIAVNPADSLNLVLSYMSQNQQSGLTFPIYFTKDGGDSWAQRSINTSAIFNQDTSLLIAGGGDPILAFDNNGKLYFSWLLAGIDTGGVSFDLVMRMYWAWSDDGGDTWSYLPGAGKLVTEGALSLFSGIAQVYGDGVPDRQWMACDQTSGPYANSLYLSSLFVRHDSSAVLASGMVVRFKRPGDSTFQRTFVQVGDTGVFNSQFSNIAVDGEGFVHVSYASIDPQGNYDGIWHAISRDGGQNFAPAVRVSQATDNGGSRTLHDRENNAPSLAVGNITGSVLMTWSTWERDANNRPVIKSYLAQSTDYGTTWLTIEDLTQLDGSVDLVHGLFPVVAYGTNDKVSVAWYAAKANRKAVYLMIESDDNAFSFSAPVLLSQDTTDFTGSTQQDFYGDYFNLVRVGCKTFAVWADGRSALGPKMYVGRVDHCAPISGFDQTPLGQGWSLSAPWPNPAEREINLELESTMPESWTVNLVSLEGKKLAEVYNNTLAAGTHSLSIELPEVTPGQYWLHISDGKYLATRRIVIK